MTDDRERIEALIENLRGFAEGCGTFWADTMNGAATALDALRARICELETEATVKDAYAYELAKQRDAADTARSDAVEALAQARAVLKAIAEIKTADGASMLAARVVAMAALQAANDR